MSQPKRSEDTQVRAYGVGTGRLQVVTHLGERPHLEIRDAPADAGVVVYLNNDVFRRYQPHPTIGSRLVNQYFRLFESRRPQTGASPNSGHRRQAATVESNSAPPSIGLPSLPWLFGTPTSTSSEQEPPYASLAVNLMW